MVEVLNAENRKRPKPESTGKNLAKEPYRKPTQVGRCGKHSGFGRMNSKELGQFAP